MKHYKIPAEQFIGWIRIARPGSVLGPQQFFLLQKEAQLVGGCGSRAVQETPLKHMSTP